MRPTTVTVTGVGSSAVVPVDHFKAPCNVAVACRVGGTATYTLQHTFANPLAVGFVAADATWLDNADVTAATEDKVVSYGAPPMGLRVTISSGDGSVAMTVVQAG